MEERRVSLTLVWLQVVMSIYLLIIYPLTCWLVFNAGVREGKSIMYERYETQKVADPTTFIGPVFKNN